MEVFVRQFLYMGALLFWDPKRDPNLENYPYTLNLQLNPGEAYYTLNPKP